MKIDFYVEDDIKRCSGLETFICDINDTEYLSEPSKLKGLCRQVAMLRGYARESVITRIEAQADSKVPQNGGESLKRFAEEVIRFAELNGNGYATSIHQLKEHIEYLLGRINNGKR